MIPRCTDRGRYPPVLSVLVTYYLGPVLRPWPVAQKTSFRPDWWAVCIM